MVKARQCSHNNLMMASLVHLELPRSQFTLYTFQSAPSSRQCCHWLCCLLTSRLSTRWCPKKLVKFQLGSRVPKPKEKNNSSAARIRIVCLKNKGSKQHLRTGKPKLIHRLWPRRARKVISISKLGKVRQAFAIPVRVIKQPRNPKRSWARRSAKYCRRKQDTWRAHLRNQIVAEKP